MCKRLKIVPKPGHVLFIGTHNRICARRRALSAATRCDAKAVAGDESSSTAPRLQSRMVARRFCASATHWPLWRYRRRWPNAASGTLLLQLLVMPYTQRFPAGILQLPDYVRHAVLVHLAQLHRTPTLLP